MFPYGPNRALAATEIITAADLSPLATENPYRGGEEEHRVQRRRRNLRRLVELRC